MGEVYRARDTRLGREVAIKVLPDRLVQDPAALSRFEREAKAVAALSHPNILAIHDFGKQDGVAYAVTELLEGKTLRERLASGEIPARKATEYGVQIARGIAAAHEKGIVHRDLKPDNVFLTRDDRIKILDFGLAKPAAATPGAREDTRSPTVSAHTEPGTVMGTVGYMSPEQVKGLPVDHRSDIFSFGAVVYEMLTGRRAFERETPVETMTAILKEEPPDLASRGGSAIAPGLGRIVARCLEKDPANRFQTARDLAFALEEHGGSLSSAPGGAVPRSSTGGGTRFRRAWVLPVLIGVAAAIVAALFLAHRGGASGTGTAIRSLAVLPLVNLSGDPSQEFFADGMTEELIADLAQIGSLRVISRTSVMRYKGTRRALPEIARELNVEGIVEGSVLRAGDRVRITAQLVHGPTDRHLWAQSYDRDLRDVLALQDEVARDIAGRVRARISSEEKARLTRDRPVNPEAYEHYLRGFSFWSQWTPEGIRRGLEEFRRALDIDPNYAPAYAGIAASYGVLTDMAVLPPTEGFPKSLEASKRALALDPSLSDAHLALGMTRLWYEWDFAGAEREIRRSVELNPGYVTGHRAYSAFLSVTGRTEEALSESAIARRLDPVSPLTLCTRALHLYYARRWREAEAEVHAALELSPGFPAGHALLGRVFAAQGKYGEAIGELKQAVSHSQESNFVAWLGYVQGRFGRIEEAKRQLTELEDRSRIGWISSIQKAAVALGMKQNDRALSWFEEAFSRHDNQLIWAYPDPLWDPIRADPRFQRIFEKVGLPWRAR